MKSQIFILNWCFCSNTIDYIAPVVCSGTATRGQDISEHAQIWIKQTLFWIDAGVWTA